MGGASKEAVAVKKVEEQVGIMQIQLHSHGGDIQEIKQRMDIILNGQDEMRQNQEQINKTLAKLL